MKIEHQKDTMYRTPERWAVIAKQGKPTLRKNTYAWVIREALKEGPMTYQEITQLVKKTQDSPHHKNRIIRRTLNMYKVVLKAKKGREDVSEKHIQKLTRGISSLEKTLTKPVEELPPLRDIPGVWYPTIEPGLSQIIARMDCAGQIKRINIGIYSL